MLGQRIFLEADIPGPEGRPQHPRHHRASARTPAAKANPNWTQHGAQTALLLGPQLRKGCGRTQETPGHPPALLSTRPAASLTTPLCATHPSHLPPSQPHLLLVFKSKGISPSSQVAGLPGREQKQRCSWCRGGRRQGDAAGSHM